MGKKYIIELEDKPFHNGNGDFLYRVKGFNSLVFDMTGVGKLTRYTEPDLEQVRKEAYEKGYKTSKLQCNIQAEKDLREVGERHYQKGLSDAWEAARKISSMDSNTRDEVFGLVITSNIFDENTASEVIEKIRQYEQEKEQSFTTEEVMRQYLDIFCKGRSCTNCLLCTPDFTCGRGKHFLHNCVSDEEVRRAYAAVLAKMKES